MTPNISVSFILLVLIISLTACKETPIQGKETLPGNAQQVDIHLIDSLGTITLSVPLRYDTSCSWTHHSDCGKSCDMHKYRFQPKNLKITKESGWIWHDDPNDSIERFTISHSEYFPFRNEDTAKNIVLHNQLKAELSLDPPNHPIVFDTIEKIGDRYYSIFQTERSDTIQLKRVFAVTTIKGNQIWFQYDLITKRKDSTESNFIKNTMNLIHTIRITKSPLQSKGL